MALENVITSLVLDVIDHDQTQGVVKAIALDSKTRYVKATLVQHGIDYPVDENATVTLTTLRPDNVGVQVTGSVVDVDNADRTGTIKGVYAELTQAALAKSGTLRAQFKITSGEQILRTEIFLVKNGIALDGETSEWADQYQGYDLEELVEKVDGMKSNITELIQQVQGKTIIPGSFQKGAYTINGPNTDPTRIYMIVENMNPGSCVEFDASRIALNYYYIKSKTDFTNLYSPNIWDTSGKIVLSQSQSDKGNTIFIVAKDVNDASSRIGDHPESMNNAITIFAQKIATRKVNWVAFGDSITNGSYSTSDGQTRNDMHHGYAYRIAKVLHSDKFDNFYNCGVRGIGWINTGNNGETFSDMMALFTGDKTAINLVTIMLGINDYISRETLGTTESAENDGTISGAIRYGLRYLCENYSNAKIVVISPLNSMNYGTAATGWSRNTKLNLPGSLQDVCDMIAHWCNIYNVTYINEISESFLNNYNMPTYLKDNLHPTDEGQWMLARELSKKIMV